MYAKIYLCAYKNKLIIIIASCFRHQLAIIIIIIIIIIEKYFWFPHLKAKSWKYEEKTMDLEINK
jgi:membrane protein YdbS with pleckstrin-like domain